MLYVNSRTLCLVSRKPLDNTPIRNQPRNNGVVISGCKPLVYLNALKPCTIRDLLFLSLYLLDCFYGEFSSLGIWLIKCYFGLRPSSLQTALWDITQHFMLAWVSSPQGTPSDQSKCAPSLGRLTRRNRSLTDIFQEFQVQVQQKESGLSRRKVASFIQGWLAGGLCEPYLPTKPNGRCACALHFLIDQRTSRMVQKVSCDFSRYRFKKGESSPCDPRDYEYIKSVKRK